MPKFQWSIIVKKSMLQVSIPTAKYLTARNPTKKMMMVKSQTTEFILKKVNNKNIKLKKFMANCLAVRTLRLECSTAVGLISKNLPKRPTLRRATGTI